MSTRQYARTLNRVPTEVTQRATAGHGIGGYRSSTSPTRLRESREGSPPSAPPLQIFSMASLVSTGLVVRHVIIFGHGHGLQRAIIDESQHRAPERLIMAQH